MPDQDPNEQEFKSLLAHYEQVWGPAHATWRTVDMYVDMTFPVWDKRDPRQQTRPDFRSPRASNILNHAVNAQSAYAPIVHRTPVGNSKKAIEAADYMEHGLTLALTETARKNTVLTWNQLFRFLFAYDYAVLRTGFELKDWTEPDRSDFDDEALYKLRRSQWERGRLHYNPLTLDSPHPSRVFLDPQEKFPRVAIERRRMTAGRVRDLVIDKRRKGRAVKDFPEARDPYEMVDVDEFWSDEWHLVFHGGDLLYKERNLLAYVPYAHAFGGHGWEGHGDQGMSPDQLGRSMLLPILDLVKLESQQMISRHHNLMKASWAPPMIKEGFAEDFAAQLAQGGIIEIPGDDGKPEYFMPANLPQWLFQEEITLDRNIQDATYSKIVPGMRPTGVDTVGQTVVLKNEAHDAFRSAQHQVEDLASWTASSFLRIVETLDFGEHIPSTGIRFGKYAIKPGDIEGDYNAVVTFEVVDPVMLLQQQQQALTEHQAGTRSLSSLLDVRRVADKTEEKKQIMVDQIMRDPVLQAKAKVEILSELGLRELAAEMEMAAQQDQRQVGTSGPLGNRTGMEPADLREPIGGEEPEVAKPPPRRF